MDESADEKELERVPPPPAEEEASETSKRDSPPRDDRGDAPATESAGEEPSDGEDEGEGGDEPQDSTEVAEAGPGPKEPPRPPFFRRVGRWIKDHYFEIDPRTLGVFRLLLGFLLAADCVRHWKLARYFYSNSGVLTNHYHLFRPSSGYNFSLFHAFSTLGEVHVAFALSFICYVCFGIGYRTRLFSILSFLWVTSMDNRLVMVENGGYVVVNLIVCWAMFMPTGRRFSVDAWLRSYRERKERTAADFAERYRPAWMTEQYVSAIVLLAVLNFATIYFFNVVNKSGQIWKRGETVHYVLHLDRMVTGLAVWVRELFPLWSLRVITWSVLALEALLVMWILSPFGRRYTRVLAIAGVWCLHASFGLMMRLGPFAWFMMGWSLLLIQPVHWDILERFYRRRAEARVVLYDAESPLAFALARVLVRLDSLELLRFEPASGELIAARNPETGERHEGTRAVREVMQALPGGRYAYPVVFLLTLGSLGPIVRWLGGRRDAVARFFGLTIPPRGREVRDDLSPLAQKLARVRVISRETLIAYLAVCAVWQALNENKSVPAVLKPKQPSFIQATIVYPRIFQGWGMFAPNPISDDGTLAIDAITVDGRHIDPFTGEAPDLDLTDARGLGLPQIWQDYFNRIRFDRNKVFRQGLREYLLDWHHQTGRPEDELVAFDVYWVRDQCPRPGQTKPYKNETIAILTYRKPNYRPAPGLPPLPPEPKVASAGN